MDITTLEQVIYRRRPGADQDAFLAENADVAAWLRAQPGFLARELAVSTDGQYADHVWWADLASAETAAAAFMETPTVAAMGEMLDPASVSFGHLHIVRSTGPVPAPIFA